MWKMLKFISILNFIFGFQEKNPKNDDKNGALETKNTHCQSKSHEL